MAAAGLVLLLWGLPLVDEVRPGGQHNLRRIATSLAGAEPYDRPLAPRAFAQLVVAPFSPGLRLWNDIPFPEQHYRAPVVAALLGAALLTALRFFARRRRRFERNIALLTIAAWIAGFAAVLGLPEPPLEYALLWLTVLGLTSWAVVAAVPLVALHSWWRGRVAFPVMQRVWPTAAIAIVVISVCVVDVVKAREADVRRDGWVVPGLSELFRAKIAEAGTDDALVIVPISFWNVTAGVVLQLRLDGIDVHVDDAWVPTFGKESRSTGRERVTLTFAHLEDHRADFRNRSHYERLGTVGDMYAYAIDAVPPASPVEGPLRIVDFSPDVSEAWRAVDGHLGDDPSKRTSAAGVLFSADEQFATIDVSPYRLLGVRLWGQPGKSWQLRCAGDGMDFVRIGRISIPSGSGVGNAEAFLWGLETCRQLKISPFDGSAPSSLNEVQLLGEPVDHHDVDLNGQHDRDLAN